jgi:drug/metabolite transporter (DMT)-like permease
LNAGQTANFVNLLPIAGVAIAILFLGEAAVPVRLIGGAIVLLGVCLATGVRLLKGVGINAVTDVTGQGAVWAAFGAEL